MYTKSALYIINIKMYSKSEMGVPWETQNIPGVPQGRPRSWSSPNSPPNWWSQYAPGACLQMSFKIFLSWGIFVTMAALNMDYPGMYFQMIYKKSNFCESIFSQWLHWYFFHQCVFPCEFLVYCDSKISVNNAKTIYHMNCKITILW